MSFIRIDTLKIHMTKRHVIANPNEKLESDECGKIMYSKRDFKYHLENVHNSSKKFICNICNVAFVLESSLTSHSNVHKSIKRFECDIFSKRFQMPRELKTHLKFHYNIRDWKCKHCDKSFTQSGHLRNHVKSVHEKDRKFQCDSCNKA